MEGVVFLLSSLEGSVFNEVVGRGLCVFCSLGIFRFETVKVVEWTVVFGV